MKKRLFHCFIVGLFYFNFAVAGQAYRVDGRFTEHYEDGTESASSFTFYFEDCKWLVRTTPDNSGVMLYYEHSFDGTNVYTYNRLKNQPLGVVNAGGAVIQKEDVPAQASTSATTLWLAYGSQCYFAGVKNGLIKPFLLQRSPDENSKLIKADLELSGVHPFLPKRVGYEPANRAYNVVEFESHGGLSIPKEFTYEVHMAGDLGAKKSMYKFHGVLTNFQAEVSLSNYTPGLTGNTYTEDRRFANETMPDLKVMYNNTNPNWIPKDSKQLQALSKKTVSATTSVKSDPNSKKRGVVVVLLLLTTTSVIFLLLLKNMKRK